MRPETDRPLFVCRCPWHESPDPACSVCVCAIACNTIDFHYWQLGAKP